MRTATNTPQTCQLIITPTSVTVTEGGSAVNVNVRLSQPPLSGETFVITPEPLSMYRITFTAVSNFGNTCTANHILANVIDND